MDQQLNSLAHFQSHSRLHFIGQWKTKAEDYFAELYENRHPEWNHGQLLQQALFIHVDMDAYFCSVALSKDENAPYRELPVAIASGRVNSEISSCNYVARKFGVHAGMWVAQAKDLCPNLVTLQHDLPLCEELNKRIYTVLLEQCPVGVSMALEVYSVDEVVIAFDQRNYSLAVDYCERVRSEIALVTNGCTASCGIADNILVARLATGFAKPNGVKCVERHEIADFMRSVPINALHGVGRAALRKLAAMLGRGQATTETGAEAKPPGLVSDGRGGLTDEIALDLSNAEQEEGGDNATLAGGVGGDEDEGSVGKLSCSVLQEVAKASLQTVLGRKNGETLYNMCRGIDHRVVRRTGDKVDQAMLGRSMPKVVGCSMNYAVRPITVDDVENILKQVIGDVASKLRRHTATTTSIRLSILERHPSYPKITHKFNGCGRCVEHSISVPLARPLSGEQLFELEQAVITAIRPRLRLIRTLSDEERQKNIDDSLLLASKQPQYHFQTCQNEGTSNEIQIDDIRGVGVTANGLAAVSYRSAASGMLSKVQRSKSSNAGQITLTAAFARAATTANVVEDVLTLSCDDGSVEEVNLVLTANSSSSPDIVAVEESGRKRGRSEHVPSSTSSGEEIFDRLRSSFPIGTPTPTVCDFACAVRWCLARDNIAAVKALLRRAACSQDASVSLDLLVSAADAEVTNWINARIPQEKRRVSWHLDFA